MRDTDRHLLFHSDLSETTATINNVLLGIGCVRNTEQEYFPALTRQLLSLSLAVKSTAVTFAHYMNLYCRERDSTKCSSDRDGNSLARPDLI